MNYDFEKRLGVDMSTARQVQGSDHEWRAYCPFCHNDRKREHQKEREFWFNDETGNWHCHNCGREGRLDSEGWIELKEKQARSKTQRATKDASGKADKGAQSTARKLPEVIFTPQQSKFFHPESTAEITDFTAPVPMYLKEKRHISEDAITLLRIGADKQYDSSKEACTDVVVFNYYLDGKLIDQKYRFTEEKKFLKPQGCRHAPYNIDMIRCQKDGSGQRPPVYIVEGEMDVASMVTAGIDRVISVPNGANANIDWIDEFWETHFEGVSSYIIAVDTDQPGNELAAKLATRLGPAKCKRVWFGDGCKDANDFLVTFGAEALYNMVQNAPEYPLPNVVKVHDIAEELLQLFREGADSGELTGWVRHYDEEKKAYTPKSLDDIVTWNTKQLALITGRSGDGKSEFLDELVIRLCLATDWKAAYFTPENSPISVHITKLAEKLVGKRFPQKRKKLNESDYMTEEDYLSACQWIEGNISHINCKVDEMLIDNILMSADSIVQRYGVKILILDPYNYIEKEMEREWMLNQWDSKTVSKIRNFGVDRDCLVFLVAHPRKVYETNKDGDRRRIEMTDISGTADFGNKADYCVVVDRNKDNNMTTVFIDKVRNKNYGDKGICFFYYNSNNGRFAPCEKLPGMESDEYEGKVDDIVRDRSNWIKTPPAFKYDEEGKNPVPTVAKDLCHTAPEELPF